MEMLAVCWATLSWFWGAHRRALPFPGLPSRAGQDARVLYTLTMLYGPSWAAQHPLDLGHLGGSTSAEGLTLQPSDWLGCRTSRSEDHPWLSVLALGVSLKKGLGKPVCAERPALRKAAGTCRNYGVLGTRTA